MKIGTKVLAVLGAGKALVVSDARENWVRISVEREGSTIGGWVHSKHLDYAASNLGRPANLPRFPVLLRAVEGTQAGESPRLYYDPQQVAKVTGVKVPPPGQFLWPGHLTLCVVHCPDDPRRTGKISGTEGIMPMNSDVPSTITSFELGFYAVALESSFPGSDGESRLISNWAFFEVK